MPLYDYKCSSCKHLEVDVYRSMRNESPEPCPVCSQSMDKQVSLPHTDMKDYLEPIVMHSVGCNSWEEIREIQRKCPDVQISDDPNNPDFGVPIARNYAQKKAVLAATGFVDRKSRG